MTGPASGNREMFKNMASGKLKESAITLYVKPALEKVPGVKGFQGEKHTKRQISIRGGCVTAPASLENRYERR